MITSVIKLNTASELISEETPEHVTVTCDAEGRMQVLCWRYETADQGLRQMAKRRGGIWNRTGGGWTFQSPESAQGMLDKIVERNPDWPVIGRPNQPFLPLAGVSISRLNLVDGLEACLIPAPLPPFTSVSGKVQAFRLAGGKRKGGNSELELGLLLGKPNEIADAIDGLTSQGAVCDDTLARKWPVINARGRKLQIKATGWAVQITCDLSDLLHYSVAPTQQYRWEGAYPYGVKVPVPWDGTIRTTRKHWPKLKAAILAVGLEYEGDDPDAELAVPASFDVARVAGWDTPAPNGHLLHTYQKAGVQFCAERGMRALIGDEMGVGKTAQAIAAAEACVVPRVVVVCPANARYVWEREIESWGARGAVQHVVRQLTELDLAARWHIITYDLIAVRNETWRFCDDAERRAFVDAFPKLAGKIEKKRGASQIRLIEPLVGVPAFHEKRIVAWEKIMKRLRGELQEQIRSIGPSLLILDEAHRAKNRNAKRTQAIQRIADRGTQMLMLTGTPLRNHEHEAATLLSLLDGETAVVLGNKKNGYTIEDVKDYLSYFMIRRTKAEVLPDLPDKTRQRIDIGALDPEQMKIYREALGGAMECYSAALERGESEATARQEMLGRIEKARAALGLAKVRGGAVSDLVIDVVENKGCCVVFCAHHDASDTLKAQLVADGLQVAIIDGRTKPKDRSALVKSFQDGNLDVLIGGINAAGEAITLTRADTVIFAELDWVPAALLQAEDRIHRVGQRSNCQVIQLIARMPVGVNLDDIMVDLIGAKMARIGAVLNEDGSNIIAGDIKANLQSRLLGVGAMDADDNNLDILLGLLAKESDSPTIITAPDTGREEAGQQVQAVMAGTADAPNVEKRKRGRPKVYVDSARPTATERSKQSIKALADAGGKRVMLRLTPEAHEALKIIMARTGSGQETAAINQAIIARKNELLRAST
ncbi:DEAD/DEAH box helicase [Paraburkholderia adhaesiva]|uniref:DEAD/DEAH box helicase n=1 Tax=Paraburkholderia adhaesiva TaxID=2883244 RepID=UPI001F3ED906|nr:DEAD/DEAH box helicase [Paraburkholderia adhaesiva]